MLQQILQDMWVDPEILAELDDSQKQTLFCRMREEQVRRWRIWDMKLNDSSKRLDCGGGSKKKVQFLMANDGKPWVWVMGEHPDDKSIEDILEEEAKEAARKQAEKETEQFRLSVEAELTELIDIGCNKKEISINDSEDIYCSVDELQLQIKSQKMPPVSIEHQPQCEKRDALQVISLNKKNATLSSNSKVSQRVAMWEKRVMEERTSEIYRKIQKRKREVVKEAEEAEYKHEQLWREQERKAKEAEQQIREIARRAREEHRRSSVLDMNTNKSDPPNTNFSHNSSQKNMLQNINDYDGPKPPNKEAIIEWFRSSEITRRAGLETDRNVVAPWFHGLISRPEAESRLHGQSVGSFLVRISEKIWGYAISYKDTDRCKHYLVDASNGHYQFLGTNQIFHNTLGDLVLHHRKMPITNAGGEILGMPCRRGTSDSDSLPVIFQGIFIKAR